MLGYIVIIGIFSLIGFAITSKLKSRFKYYSQIGISSGMTGAQIAQKMMDDHNIHDVKIVQGKGMLTDHYNPKTKTVSLSPAVYQGRSIAAAAVAAHESGHVVQHAQNYSMLTMRSNLVPLMQISSRVQQMLILAVIAGYASGTFGNILMLILVGTFGMTALFSLITLPVEFDASNRALAWLDQTGTVVGTEHDGAKESLKWAALTYVSKAMGSLVLFLFLLLKVMGGNRE